MMKSDIAIKATNIKKDFHLPRHGSNSIKTSIVNAFKPKDKGVDVHHALKDISFEVKKGEFFGILGRNGSGKSTLLKIISEIYQPTSGSVQHNGTLVSFIELGVGFKPELSGRDNVYLNGALLGFSKSEIDYLYEEIVRFAELEEFMEQKIKNYSSGMKVRLAFSVAIQAKSDILILDEVLAVGDASFQKKCYEYFKTLKEDKSKTIVFVTHSMGAVKKYCDRAILIDGGHIIHEGDAGMIANKYLELFNTGSKNKSVETNIAEITSIDAHTVAQSPQTGNMISTNDKIEITVKIKIKQSIDSPVFAFSFRNSKGLTVFATNTDVIDVNFGKIEKGEKTLKFTIDNIFTNDTYHIYATLFDAKMQTIYTRVIASSVFMVDGVDTRTAVAIAHPKVKFNASRSMINE